MSLKDIRSNPLMLTDDYNLSHQMLKCNTDWEVSHLYNRGQGQVLYGFNETVIDTFNITVTMDMIREADSLARLKNEHFPVDLFLRLLYKTGGKIPVIVEALQDGTWVPAGTPFAQIRNSVKGFGELVTYFEALLLQSPRFGSQCATRALMMRRYLEEQRKIYGYDESFLYRLHSFGFRGHRSLEDAYWAGTAWNLFLYGTDDFHSIKHTQMMGPTSIPALAHKVVQQFDKEEDCYFRAIDQAKAAGDKIVAIVIDTYSSQYFIYHYAHKLATYAKDRGITIVFRPDSDDKVAGTVTEQAYAIFGLLCVHATFSPGKDIAVIIGEDMTFDKVIKYDKELSNSYYHIPLNFINYGIGEGFYKDFDRSSSGWCMKTAYSNGKARMKFTQDKQSIPGVVRLVENYNDFEPNSSSVEKVIECMLQEEYEKATLPGKTLYYTPYLYNISLNEPVKVNRMSWAAIKQNVDQLVNKENFQKEIFLSKGIADLTEELRKQYLGNEKNGGYIHEN